MRDGRPCFFCMASSRRAKSSKRAGIVVRGLGVRHLVRRIVRKNHAEVVGLHLAVGRTGFARGRGGDFGQQFAVGAFGRDVDLELMKGGLVAHAGQRFAVLRASFRVPRCR